MTKKLCEYLKAIFELEKDRFLQEQMIVRLKDKISQLGIPKQIEHPRTIPSAKPSDLAYKAAGITTIIGAILGFLSYSFVYQVNGRKTYLGIVLLLTVIGAVVFGAVALMLASLSVYDKNKDIDDENRIAYNNYKREVDKDKARVDAENATKVYCFECMKQIENGLLKTEQSLAQLYSLNVIFPKYHNLAAISSIYEYMLSGKCLSLRGAGGAYAVYDNEELMGRIITKLEEIIARLAEIKANQYMLHQAITESNRRLDYIAGSIDQSTAAIMKQNADFQARLSEEISLLNTSSALAAYNAEKTARELEFANKMEYFSGLSDYPFIEQK